MAAPRYAGGPAQDRAPRHHLTTAAPPSSNAAPNRRVIHALRLRLDSEHRFGPPSTYDLSRGELAAHVRKLRCGGWQQWELTVRFGRWAA